MPTWAVSISLGVLTTLVAASVAARDLYGTDSMTTLIVEVRKSCPGAAQMTYRGGGSARGESALVAHTQQVAPMTRMFDPARVCSQTRITAAEGLLVALDAVGLAAPSVATCGVTGPVGGSLSVTEANGVPGLQCSGCAPDGTYQLRDWRDPLRILYAGMDHDAGDQIVRQDCNSDLRRALASNWAAVVGGSCPGASCAGIRHAFRPGDRSSTAATFLEVLGLPPDSSNAFCNGSGLGTFPFPTPREHDLADFRDLDPIRRPCVATDQVCRKDGTLGLVLPIGIPAGLTASQLYPTQPCTVGTFKLFPAFDGLVPEGFRCPNDGETLFQKCFQPYRAINDPITGEEVAADAFCVAPEFPYQGYATGGITHGAVYNLGLKRSDGVYRLDASGRPVTGAYFRLHAGATPPGGGVSCQAPETTQQITCLTQSGGCSVGVGRLQTTPAMGSRWLPIGGIEPTLANVTRLEAEPPDPMAYPLAARLMLSSIIGFVDVTEPAEGNLAGCFHSKSLVAGAATAAGVIPLSAGPRCVDFDERQCGAEFNTNACIKRSANMCPVIDEVRAAPLEQEVGRLITLSAAASDLEQDALTYRWKAAAGTFANRDAPSTTYTCTTVGPQTIVLTVWDGLCAESYSVPIHCHPAEP